MAPVPRTSVRPIILILLGGGVALLAAAAWITAWWGLPRWAPQWSIEHSPWFTPALHAALRDPERYGPALLKRVALERATAAPVLVAHFTNAATNTTERQLLADALSQIADPRAFETLMQALDSDPSSDVRAAMALGLGRIGDERAAPAIVERCADEHPFVRHQAAYALGLLPVDRVALLLPLLQHAQPGVRASTVSALGRTTDDRATAPLIAAAHDAQPTVRAACASVLPSLTDPAAKSAALALGDDPHASVRRALMEAVLEHPDESARAVTFRLLHDSDDYTRLAAIRVVAVLKGDQATATLLPLLNDPTAEIRIATARALGLIGDHSSVPALQRALHDPDPVVQMWARRALRMLGIEPAVAATP